MIDDTSSRCSSQGTYSNLNYYSADELEYNVASIKKDKLPIVKGHKCTRFSAGEDLSNCNQCKVLAASPSQAPCTGKSKRVMDNRRLTRNRSLIDIRSQLLHRSLVEEVHKRRLFKTVGAVENIGFQAPCDVSTQKSQPVCVGKIENSSRGGKGEKVMR